MNEREKESGSVLWQQTQVAQWVKSRLGEEQLFDPHERCLRLLEETLELAQVVGIGLLEIHRLIPWVYRKPPGQLEQEAAGVGTTLLAFAAACDFDLLRAIDAEILRIYSLPPEKFVKRQKLNADSGIGKQIGDEAEK